MASGSSTPKVSVVMTTYKRDPLLWRTLLSINGADEVIVVDDSDSRETEMLCRDLATYIPCHGRPPLEWSNPARPINIGLRAASGDVVILQNAECEHVSNVVDQFRERVRDGVAVFAKVKALNKDGSMENYYTAPVYAERPYFFCGAMAKKHFDELGGMDETFVGPGYDDDDFAIRMKKAGIKSEFADDILVNHQWHSGKGCTSTSNADIFKSKHGVGAWW